MEQIHTEHPPADAAIAEQPTPAPAGPADVAQVSNETHISRINKIVRNCHTCMLTTRGEQGRLHTRPMATAGVDFETGKGECIYFVTDADTVKVKEIEADPEISMSFCNDAKCEWATMSARAEVYRDVVKIKEMWHPAYNMWFPKGPETPGVLLIKATPRVGCYWKGTGVHRLSMMFSMLTARVRGGAAKMPDMRKAMMQDTHTVTFPTTSTGASTSGAAGLKAAGQMTPEEALGAAAGIAP